MLNWLDENKGAVGNRQPFLHINAKPEGAGDDQSYESVFEKFGIIRTHSMQEFCSAERMFAV